MIVIITIIIVVIIIIIIIIIIINRRIHEPSNAQWRSELRLEEESYGHCKINRGIFQGYHLRTYLIIRQDPQAGTMPRILCSDWQPERYCPLGIVCFVPALKFRRGPSGTPKFSFAKYFPLQ